MRIAITGLMIIMTLGALIWVELSGGVLLFFGLLWILLVLIAVKYPDKVILFILGAREITAGDEGIFHQASRQEAYKLRVPVPKLYFYNGTLERGYVLQNSGRVSLVINKELLRNCNEQELSAICFELLIQVIKGMAIKRTRVLFLIGIISWISYSLMGGVLAVLPFKNIKKACYVFWGIMLTPFLEFLYRITLTEKFFKTVLSLVDEFPKEKQNLFQMGLKLRVPEEVKSIASRRLIDFSSINKSRQYRAMLSIEFLPHEWDLIAEKGLGFRA